MLRIHDLSYTYPGRGKALRGVSAKIPEGLTLLVGPNAGGKTTLLRILAGLYQQESGAITDAAGTALRPADLRRLGRMVMQDADPQLVGGYVGEDIRLGKAASSLGETFDAEARRLVDSFGLADYWHEPVDALSYGQKRKLCLIHALLAGPRVLLLDEPFAGLDFPSSRELREFIIESRNAGLTLVVSTHELEPVFDLADWLVVVKDGVTTAEGEPDKLRARLPEWSVRPPGGGWD